MPLVFIQGRLAFFAHVPKCGGTAVENYLHARFGRLAFLDRAFNKIPDAERWTKTSPQHLEAAAFDRIIPQSWVTHRFAVIRHPQDRIVSVFRFQRDVERSIDEGLSFSDWLAAQETLMTGDRHRLDNHARPATDLVPADCRIFRLEDGLGDLVGWLDQIEGASRAPREVGRANDYGKVMGFLGREPRPAPDVTAEDQATIARIYAADFTRFGYTPYPATSTASPKACKDDSE
ncbi:sulfotransferase family 2 domain-containing protein [Roseicyclus mahoneyensis]|uniref:Sulfotransferase family protein n=1 Tax=Roseicyclus mahoneyensis TaxID=164332 RepID=A0A316GGL5_9RHOB|nr:sulfotransferase family 2 domain-containing protein [Roseicyclus mahoneyensis]PWK60107.1 sulfotransferase family protein [Roseicyclus mahoneyensis]